MKRVSKVGIGVTGIVVLLICAMVLVVALFDWNTLRGPINDKVSAALGRPFAINGDLDVVWGAPPGATGIAAWIPSPHLSADDITLGNPKDFDSRRMAHLQRVDVWLAPLGLLHHTIDIPRIALAGADATLIQRADGHNNWTLATGQSKSSSGPDSSSWKLAVDRIYLDRGDVTYRDAVRDADVQLTIRPLGGSIPYEQLAGRSKQNTQKDDLTRAAGRPGDFVFGWSAKGHYKGVPLSGSGKTGGVLALDDAAHPFPIAANVRSGDTRVRIAGQIIRPMDFGGAELDVEFSGPSLDQLHRLLGVTLPATPAYATDGHVSARFQDSSGARFAYRDFNGRIGHSDVHGSLVFTMGEPRPKLTGAVVSDQLRMVDLAPLVGADSASHQKARGVSRQQPAGKVLPVEPFDTAAWRTMDADVKFTAKKVVRNKGLPIEDIYAHVRMDDGDILLDPLSFGVARGHVNTTLRLEGSRSPMAARIDMHARALVLDDILPRVEALDSSYGHLNGDASISGRGDSVASLMAGADGRVTVLMDRGAISRNLMELAGLNVGNYLVGKLFGDEPTRINCAAADIPIDDGVARPNVLVFDTQDAVINVTGETDFADETLDFTITPKSKGPRIFTLRTPLTLHGTYADPSPGVKPGPLIARGAVAVVLGVVGTPAASLLALISPTGGEDNQCAPVIDRIKQASQESNTSQ